jgi:hypothetical protein
MRTQHTNDASSSQRRLGADLERPESCIMTSATPRAASESVRPSAPRPVLMIPLRRCGSHALRLRLNASPEFHSPYPIHIIDFMPLVPCYGDLRRDENYFELVVDVVGLQAVSLVKWRDHAFDPVEIFEATEAGPRSVHRVVWELLLRAGARHQAKVVMDKSLDSVRFAWELAELFPDLLFLNVVRDPRAQVASMNRAIIHDFDTALNAYSWASAHDIAQDVVARFPERTLTIRYEDFLSDQEATLRTISEFLGIEYRPDMLDLSGSEEAQQIAKRSALWSANCSPPIESHRDKFKSQLSWDEIEVIESVTEQHMRRYGYERMTVARRMPDERDLSACRERSELARQRAWQDLERRDYRDFALRRFRAAYLDGVRSRLECSPPRLLYARELGGASPEFTNVSSARRSTGLTRW